MILTNQVIVSEQFNKYFVTVAQDLVHDIGETANKFQDYLKNPNEHSMFLKEVEPAEIKKIIINLDIKGASDIFDITPKLLKAASDKLIEPLTFLFNETIKKGLIPQKLKMAVVYPIHKKESKIKVSNYRPISILPLVSKIFEKPIHERLMDFFNKHDIIYKHQFGFQRGKSTEHAFLDLLYNIVSALETKDKVCSIFLDFAKAFNTVNHDMLLSKLEYYGMRGSPLKLMNSYLSGRTQCVKIGGSTSEHLNMWSSTGKCSGVITFFGLYYLYTQIRL